jgi:hypothetical protein
MDREDIKFWLAGALVAGSLTTFAVDRYRHRSMQSAPVAGVPEQTPLSNAPAFAHRGHALQPVAAFTVRAKLLSAEPYRADRGSALSPIDFALGWDRMSDDAVLARLRLTQSLRFFNYRWEDAPPIPPEEIVRSASNMHLIPANEVVERKLFAARRGQIVVLRGQLVDVQGPDGWQWRSSRIREDTGPGACEVVWVEAVTLEGD